MPASQPSARSKNPQTQRKVARPRDKTKAQGFHFHKVRAHEPELGAWLQFDFFADVMYGRRPSLAALFHQAISMSKESLAVEKRVLALRKSGPGRNETQGQYENRIYRWMEAERLSMLHYRYVAQTAAESLIYTLDFLIGDAATSREIPKKKKSGRTMDKWSGGRYVAPGITLIEAIRVIANYQRHHYEWRNKDPLNLGMVYNPVNWSHKVLKKMGYWNQENVALQFIKDLKYTTYQQLERDFIKGMAYLILEMGMKYGERAVKDRLAAERTREESREYIKDLKERVKKTK